MMRLGRRVGALGVGLALVVGAPGPARAAAPSAVGEAGAAGEEPESEGEASVGDDLRAMARIAQQSGEVVAHYASALADDNVSPDEAGQMLPVVRELMRSLATLEHDLAETVKERGRRRRLHAVGGR